MEDPSGRVSAVIRKLFTLIIGYQVKWYNSAQVFSRCCSDHNLVRHFLASIPEGRVITNHKTSRYRGGERTFSDRDKGLRNSVREGRESPHLRRG